MQRLQDTYEEQRFPCCHCPSLAFSVAQDSLASAAAAAAAELLQLRHLLQQVANSLAGAQSLPLGHSLAGAISLSLSHARWRKGCCGAANSLSRSSALPMSLAFALPRLRSPSLAQSLACAVPLSW